MTRSRVKGKFAKEANSTASRIIAMFDLDPTLSSTAIAKLCDTDASYVRHVLCAAGLKLFRKANGPGFGPYNEARKSSSA